MSNIISQGDIVRSIAEQTELSPAVVESVVKEFQRAIAREMNEKNEVRLTGFGTFKTSERAARTGRNPKTGEALEIAAKTIVTFKTGKDLQIKAKSTS